MRLEKKTTATLLVAIFMMSTMIFAYAAEQESVGMTVNVGATEFNLELTVVGNGEIGWDAADDGAGIVTDSQVLTFDGGTEVTLTPYPDEGSLFTVWSGTQYLGSDIPVVITMDTNKAVTATFTLKVISIKLGSYITIDFGDIPWGGDLEGYKDVQIWNMGNVDVDITATIDEGTETFYQSCLMGATSSFLVWTSYPGSSGWVVATNVPKTFSRTFYLRLVNVQDPGIHTGTLVFWAEESAS